MKKLYCTLKISHTKLLEFQDGNTLKGAIAVQDFEIEVEDGTSNEDAINAIKSAYLNYLGISGHVDVFVSPPDDAGSKEAPNLAPYKLEWYRSLPFPEAFSTKDAVISGKSFGMSKRSVELMLTNRKLFKQKRVGYYIRLSN